MLPEVRQENFLQKDGRLWMTAEMLGRQLGYNEPRNSINTILSRNREELEPFTTDIKLMSVTGEKDAIMIDEQGCYIVSMLARTDQAKQFRRALAKFLADMRRKHALFTEQYLKMRVEAEKYKLRRMMENNGFSLKDIDRIFFLKTHLTTLEISRIYQMSVSTANKLLTQMRRAAGDFEDRRPEHLKKQGELHG